MHKSRPDSIIVDPEFEWIFETFSFGLTGPKRNVPVGTVMVKGKKHSFKIHHLIIGKIKGLVVDHINGDTLDNRKCNLRHVTYSVNLTNRPQRLESKQKYKGIQKLPSGRYRAKGPKGCHWGTFNTAEQAFKTWETKTKKILNIKHIGDNYATPE